MIPDKLIAWKEQKLKINSKAFGLQIRCKREKTNM